MANTNKFQGLSRGPIDHKSSSVINQVSNGSIDMGGVVSTTTTIQSSETLPRVSQTTSPGGRAYGIAVGGDIDGIYGDGSTSTDDSTRATNAAGQGVVVVTQGRCLAKVNAITSDVAIGDELSNLTTSGVLTQSTSITDIVIARALNTVTTGDTDMIAVDVQREGLFT